MENKMVLCTNVRSITSNAIQFGRFCYFYKGICMMQLNKKCLWMLTRETLLQKKYKDLSEIA
ncbi:hypothetical protein CCY97_07420 [Helicobacter sp. 10-6591]|nr:hypothetical protein CCY97_07420 [Helicobacter sp. 10-6591]